MVACFVLEHFAIACEWARLPRLQGMPTVLTADEATVTVASPEATAAFGIAAGMTVSAARSLGGADLIVLPYDREAYTEAATSLWDLYAVESDTVEPVSPEVCYVEMIGKEIPERVARLAEQIAVRVRVPLRVGIARSKIVAHHAAGRSRAGAVVVPVGEEWRALAGLPIAQVPRIDHKTRTRLHRLGIETLGDIARLPPARFPRDLKRTLPLLHALAHGQDGDTVKPLWPPRRRERSLRFPEEEEITELPRIEAALRILAEELARDLSKNGDYCRTVTLRLGLDDGAFLQETEKRSSPTATPNGLTASAHRLLPRLPVTRPIRSLTLIAGDLGAGSGIQLALLGDSQKDDAPLPHERQRRLNAALAYLRRRYGVRVLVTGSLLRQARRIGLWTFPLGHLLDEPIQVATDARGTPVRYWRRNRKTGGEWQPRTVTRVQDRWRDRSWQIGSIQEHTAYRVETDPWGVSELHALPVEWRLTGVLD